MNRNPLLSERKLARALRARAEWRVLPVAFLATLLALPVNAAVTIPVDPLASGVRVAPNILFILDDSGSMAWENINNGDVTSITGTNFSDNAGTNGIGSGYSSDLTDETGNSSVYEQTYITNTLYYNPFVDYEPWMNADGNRLSGGTAYDDAYSSGSYVDYTGVESNSSSGQIDLSDNTRTFHAPRDHSQTGSTYLSNIANYWRYQVIAGGADVVRSEWGPVVESAWTSRAVSPNSGSVRLAMVNTHTIASVSGGEQLYVEIESNNSRHARYRLRDPSNNVVCDLTFGDSETRSCQVVPATAGSYSLLITDANPDNNWSEYELRAWSRTTNRCGNGTGSYDWITCTSNRPDIPNTSGTGTSQRSVDDEKINFATWYSYYRTRTKAAKGGAAEAFNTLGNRVRVGYRTIHDRSNFNIPVGDGNDGRFVNNDGTNGNPTTTSRSVWFNRLFNAAASSGTPLQEALKGAGQYFSGDGSSGPYGPEATANQLSCRQNFSILTTDGYWNEGRVDTDSGSHGDGSNGTIITNGLPTTDLNYKTYQYLKPAPYADGNSNTLADVAMRYWKRDLRTDLDNNVPSDYSKVAAENNQIGRDPAFWQHMVTFGISIGLKAKSGLSSVSNVTTATTWAAPGDDDQDNIDDLLHAAVNGRGTFVSASSPQAFADGLAAALSKINERTAAFSNVGASDTTQLNNGTLIFTASYVSGRWTGLLRAENAVTGAESWKTTDTGKFTAHSSRTVITRSATLTGGVGAGGTGSGATFPTSAQETALTRTGGPANYEVSGANNALYIKGDTSREGGSPGQLRMRSTVMGDVVNSSPAYVQDSHTVFVGANDGMLHAFDAATGVERFAYVPGIINFGNLADISRGDYEHRWFVDGPIAISSKAMSPDGTKNILIGTLGRGGRGLYALNVTTPTAFTTADVKWERRSTNSTAADDNMGMVLGAPILAKVRTAGVMPNPTLTSVVVLGNGINSGSDKAALLVLNMDDGSVIREIPTESTTSNGLFAPTGIYAADGKTLVYAYAGDLQGNVWKFDLTNSNPASWTSKKIFHAEKTTGTPQPITGGIASAVDARTNQRWVFFGTGSYLTAADGNDTGTEKQSMYGVMDDVGTGSAYTRSNLTARTVTTDASGNERYFQNLASITNKGWYVDLPGVGERIVQNAQLDGSYLVTASMMPSGNSCADAAGSGFINAITPFPGMTAGNKSYFDLDGDGNTDDTGTSGKPTGSYKTSGMPTLPLLMPGTLFYQTSAAGGGGKLPTGKPQWNRVSWREMRHD